MDEGHQVDGQDGGDGDGDGRDGGDGGVRDGGGLAGDGKGEDRLATVEATDDSA